MTAPEKNPQAEMERMRQLEERIKAPSIWGRTPCGIRFEDLQDRRYDEAVKFLKKHYLTEEITYRSLKITEDKEGTDEFIHNARIWMKDKMSIAVIKEGKEKLVGLIIMRIQEKTAFSRTFSRVKLTHNPIYATIMTFYNKIEEEIDLFKILGVKKYLKIYVIALKPRYRHRGFAKELIKSAILLARSGFVPAIAGIFTTGNSQRIADEIGFEKHKEIYYTRYTIDKEIVFWDLGQGNYGAAIMAYRIPDVDEPIDLVTKPSSRFNVKITDEEDVEAQEGEGAKKEEENETEEKKKTCAYTKTFNRVKPTYNPLYTTVAKFFDDIDKPINLFEKLGVNKYLKIHVWALKLKHRHQGIGKELLKSAIMMAKTALVPAISGIFTTSRGQQIAEEIGFTKFNEIQYEKYIIMDELVFWYTCQGNHSAALMAYRIPNVEEPRDQQTHSSRYAVVEDQSEAVWGEDDFFGKLESDSD